MPVPVNRAPGQLIASADINAIAALLNVTEAEVVSLQASAEGLLSGLSYLGVGGTVTVTNSDVTADSLIIPLVQTVIGTPGTVSVSSRVPGVSFTISSTSSADTSKVGWVMIQPSLIPTGTPQVIASDPAAQSDIARGGTVIIAEQIGAFQPLFAVSGGSGRSGAPAFMYSKIPTTVFIDDTISQIGVQNQLVTDSQRAGQPPWINYNQFTTKRIEMPNNTPLEPVLLYRSNWGGGFTGTNYPSWALGMDQVCRGGFPVPPDYVPDAGSDKELAIIQPTYTAAGWSSLSPPLAGRYFEGWIFEKNPSYDPLSPKVWPNFVWRCGWPARVCGMNIWPGHFVDWNFNNPQSFWPFQGIHGTEPANPDGTWQSAGEGASASGLALADCEILIEDLHRNIVGGTWGLGHTIGLSVPSVGGYRWPANRSDATSTSTFPLKYGMRLVLPNDYVIPAGLHPVCHALIQNCIPSDDATKPCYGLVIHEQTNSSLVFKAQPGAEAYWPGVSPATVLSGFPWNQLKVVGTGGWDGGPTPITTGPAIPANTDPPVLGGAAFQGLTVGLSRGTWVGAGTITYAYGWQVSTTSDGSVWTDVIGNATQQYVVLAGDVGKRIRGKVTATSTGGSTTEFTTASDIVGTGNAPFMRDTFTGTNGVTVESRAGEIGASPWTKMAASTASTSDTIQANRAMGPVNSGTNIYYSSAIPSSPNYDVTIFMNLLTDNATSHVEAAGRMSTTTNSHYFVQYFTGTDLCSMHLIDNGTITELDRVTQTPKVSLTLRMVGDQITMIIDGVAVHGPVTNSVITAAGRAGFRHGGVSGTAAGIHIESVEAVVNVAVGTVPTNTAIPVVGGPKIQAQTVGLWSGTWTGTAPITLTYKWQRSANSGGTWSDIAGAVGQTYLIQSADVGNVLRCGVIATNSAGSTTAFSVATSTVLTSATSTLFARDSFTGTDGVTIQSRSGEVGTAPWTLHASSTATAGDNDTIRANRAMGPVGTTGTNIYYSSAVPANPDYDVVMLINELTDNNASHLTVAGRMSPTANTMYGFQYLTATNTCNLILINGGALTTLDTATLAPRASMTLRMIGDQISGIADGAVVLGPVADGTLTGVGRAGFRHGAPNTTAAGIHLEQFEAASYPAVVGPPSGNVLWTADAERNIQFDWVAINDHGIGGGIGTTTSASTETNATRVSRSTFSNVGTRSYKFTIVNTDRDYYNTTTRQRTEVGMANPDKTMADGISRRWHEGDDRWISFQVYLPTNHPLDRPSNTFAQFKQVAGPFGGGGGPALCLDAGSSDGANNAWRLFRANDITGGSGLTAWCPALKNVWSKHSIHIKFSPNPAVGFIEYFVDNGDGTGMRTVLPKLFTWTMKRDGSANGNPLGAGNTLDSHARMGMYRQIYNVTSDIYIDGYTTATTRAAAEANAFGGTVVIEPTVVDLTDPAVLASTYTKIETALARTDTALTDGTQYPNYTTGGVWTPTSGPTAFPAGFLPGQFWLTFERTAATTWRDRAISWQDAIDNAIPNSHDLGFMFMNSFVKGFQQVGTVAYRTSALAAATILRDRWNAVAGVINSQPFFTTPNTIIDSAMNMELLFWAADNGHSDAVTLRARATQHLMKLITAHVRADGGSFQVTQYNATTGTVVDHPLSQGFSISSTWSRGQAWGITGLTRGYRYIQTSDPTNAATLLAGAVKMAGYFVDNLPADGIPKWDFNAPDAQKDSSAAAVAASGLLELSNYDTSRDWYVEGLSLLNRLAAPGYLATPAEGFEILKHGVSNNNAPVGVDEGLSYGDMYFIEALGQL